MSVEMIKQRTHEEYRAMAVLLGMEGGYVADYHVFKVHYGEGWHKYHDPDTLEVIPLKDIPARVHYKEKPDD